ncbi:unnamed protein product [Bursaphelenchus xylophilus]|nr:unnamed protein product [Bursaphelenchus xylophilus]CAG9089987.1 unnamed protein product [Bursaphelenchus xylophilus]
MNTELPSDERPKKKAVRSKNSSNESSASTSNNKSTDLKDKVETTSLPSNPTPNQNHIVVIGDRELKFSKEFIDRSLAPEDSYSSQILVNIIEDGLRFVCTQHTVGIRTKYYTQNVFVTSFNDCETFWAWLRAVKRVPQCIIFLVDFFDTNGHFETENDLEGIASNQALMPTEKIVAIKGEAPTNDPWRERLQNMAREHYMALVTLNPNEDDREEAANFSELLSYERIYELVTLCEWNSSDSSNLLTEAIIEAKNLGGVKEIVSQTIGKDKEAAESPRSRQKPRNNMQDGNLCGVEAELISRLQNINGVMSVFGPQVKLRLQDTQMEEEFETEMQGVAQQRLQKIWKDCYDQKARAIIRQRLVADKIRRLESEQTAEFFGKAGRSLKLEESTKLANKTMGKASGEALETISLRFKTKEEVERENLEEKHRLEREKTQISQPTPPKESESKKTEQNRKKKEKKKAKKLREKAELGNEERDEANKLKEVFDNIKKVEPEKLEGKDMKECLEKWKKVDSLSIDEKVVVAANLANNYIKNNSNEVAIQIEEPKNPKQNESKKDK